MYGDFSRVTYDPAKHYSSVLYQQGRVRLDAEDNELQAILRHSIRAALVDILGDSAAAGDGFSIGFDSTTKSLTIHEGVCYVDGIRVVNHPPNPDLPYWQQPYLLVDHDVSQKLPDTDFSVYLRVWHRSVGPAQDPRLREVALGDLAPDTALRGQVVWQVLTGPAHQSNNNLRSTSDTESWHPAPSPALLMAQAKQPDPVPQGPCTTSPASEYRGPENQLYRVEVHVGGRPGDATFKWSRDNGSVTAGVVQLDGAVATVERLGRDGKTAFEVGDTVELVDDRSTFALPGTPPQKLLQVIAVDTLEETVTLSDEPGITTDASLHPILRRWDAPEQPIVEGEQWLILEDGVQVNFSRSAEGDYVTGDYWLIPARVATGDVEWPTSVTGQPIPQPPKGIQYHYALLAEVDPANDQVTDLRPVIAPITSGAERAAASTAPAPAPAPMVREAPTQHEAGVNPTAANRPEITPPVIFPGEPPATA